jgi:NTE family protein
MMPKLSASYPRALVALALTSAFLVAAPPSRADQAAPVQSTQAQSTQAQSHRPRIGLVLAGGGAKGGAHVGVLKVLEEMHVPIDCIAGTSMGALVGGGYASGIPADELETFVTTIDWKRWSAARDGVTSSPSSRSAPARPTAMTSSSASRPRV